jgi:hypothetical protein
MPCIASVRRFAAALLFIGLFAGVPAKGEIEKFMTPCAEKEKKVTLCGSFRASITIPEGWVQDKEASAYFDAKMLLPKGIDFEKAPVKIYVVVRYNRDKQSVSDFMPDSVKDWKSRAKNAKISKLDDLPRGGGKQAFQRHQFEAPSLDEQGYEFQSVTIDSDKDGNQFVVAITLSANTREAVKAAEPAYLAILSKY